MSQIVKNSSGGGGGSDVLTLSDDIGTSITPNSSGNIQLVGHVNNQTGEFSTVVAGTHLADINPMSSFRWIVDPLGFNGTSTTMQAAINSASAGDTIQILPGTYTENLTLKDGLSFVTSDAAEVGKNSNVKIIGKMTDNGSEVNCSFTGIGFQTNSDYIATLSAASNLVFTNCFFSGSNNTLFQTSNGGINVYFYRCQGNLGTTGIAFCSTTGGIYRLYNSQFTNSGNTTTVTNFTAGSLQIDDCELNFPVEVSSTGFFQANYSTIDTSAVNQIALTTAGAGTSSANFCQFSSGTASAISIGTGTTLTATFCDVNSTNTNAITGAGTINYGGIVYSGTSITNNVTTQNTIPWPVIQGGTGLSSPGTSGNVLTSTGTAWASSAPATFSKINIQTFTSSGTYTPTTGMKYCIIECQAGGGGSGGAGAGAAAAAASGGGGGGGYARKFASAATVGSTQTITVGVGGTAGSISPGAGGVGGTSSVGSICIAQGGGGGTVGTSSATILFGSGSSGQSGLAGDFFVIGGTGGSGCANFSGGYASSGYGGVSYFGGSARGVNITTAALSAGNTGLTYGGGASGAAVFNDATGTVGSVGGAGIVVITEYI